jgi:hypothetical protein
MLPYFLIFVGAILFFAGLITASRSNPFTGQHASLFSGVPYWALSFVFGFLAFRIAF